MRHKSFPILNFVMFCMAFQSCLAQEDNDNGRDKAKVPGATLKGKLVQNENPDFQIDLAELKTTLDQQVKLPPPPLPDDWKDMNVEQRQAWARDFDASERGKAFIEERKKILESAPHFDLRLEDDGSFVVYDVPEGIYGLRGELEKTISDRNYIFEVFGQISVGGDVDEVLLDPISVTVTRWLVAGEPIPNLDIETFDGKNRIDNSLLSGRNVLVSFWSLKSPPSLEFSKTIQEMYAKSRKKNNLQLFSICINSERDEALKYVKEQKIKGLHGFAKSWEHETVNEFGVRSIPALFLVGTDGKIKMTHADFQQAFRAPNAELTQIVEDSIAGKLPKPVNNPDKADSSGGF